MIALPQQPAAVCRAEPSGHRTFDAAAEAVLAAWSSLYDEARREADRHKWLESERYGHDLGERAIHDWYHRFWLPYCRFRRLEHVRGARAWREFGGETFGCLYSLILAGDTLADRVLDRVDAGHENLCIINWALEWGLPMLRVIDILEQIDVNRARLDPRGA